MTSIYLVSYDIQNDRQRKKVADKLIELGLERVQYSVFAGPLKDHLLLQLKAWLPPHLPGPEDRLFLLPLPMQSIRRGMYIGSNLLDEAYMLNTQHTLYFD
ncbi:MAG TPA: CRISPR-associated endonuclease Cas2 [Saprospiraceae bacterium]|mgnify:CR=1 FL=1|nr:CRISPR-associated endonuclease Cas2 [Saprospiraceae bacterium]HMP26216.1 CRISPR-associated endonuclease Cas2 [Saprospiraceae bacterium]